MALGAPSETFPQQLMEGRQRQEWLPSSVGYSLPTVRSGVWQITYRYSKKQSSEGGGAYPRAAHVRMAATSRS